MVGPSTGWLSSHQMLFPRALTYACFGLSLPVLLTAPAAAQMYPGQDVTVNLRAGGVTTVLYPGGKYGRNVGVLLQPGEKPNAVIHLRKPGTYRARPIVARARPAPTEFVEETPAPRRAAPKPPRRSQPSAPPVYAGVPVGSAAALIPDEPMPQRPQPSRTQPTRTQPQPTRVASASPAPMRTDPMDAGLVRQSTILFNPGTTELPAETFENIRVLAGTLNRGLTDGASRVQLMAYGGPRGDKSSESRRLSLKRALVLREILMEDGVSADRINVRAMGGADSGPSDRVDVYLKS